MRLRALIKDRFMVLTVGRLTPILVLLGSDALVPWFNAVLMTRHILTLVLHETVKSCL